MSATTSPTGRDRLRGARGPLLIGAAVVLVGLLIALLTPRAVGEGPLDPDSARPDGARAVVQVLRDQGVDVEVVRDSRSAAEAAPGATVLIDRVPVMAREQLDRVATAGAARLVLITPDTDQLAVLAPGVSLATVVEPRDAVPPGCDDPDAQAAGPAAAGGVQYVAAGEAAAAAEICYGSDEAGPYVHLSTTTGREVVVLGRPGLLTNERVADEGNAALALRTLGSADRLVWYIADPLEPAPSQRNLTMTELLPRWVPWVGGWLAVVTLAAMLWRGRRLGPLVTEPLPVTVRAAEAQEGRARLYRQARARDRAADALRAASARRLAHRLAHGKGGSAAQLVTAAAAASGRREDDVRALLLGPAPASDLALVRLADDLDKLESEVIRGHDHR